MNAPCTPRPGLDAFHKDRSKCIDAFSAVEEALLAAILATGGKASAASFGQKLAQLRKAKATPAMSAERLTKLQGLLDDCLAIGEVRNDIVHSVLKLAVIGDDQRACFVNLRSCNSGSQIARLFTLEGLRSLTSEMNDLAQKIRAV